MLGVLLSECEFFVFRVYGFNRYEKVEEKQFGAPVQIGSLPSLGPFPTPLKGVPGVGGNLPFGLVLRSFMV